MFTPYITDADRRALTADRQRAARPLADLVASERTDLAVRPAVGRARDVPAWRWTAPLRAIQSLASAIHRRPAAASRRMTRECA